MLAKGLSQHATDVPHGHYGTGDVSWSSLHCFGKPRYCKGAGSGGVGVEVVFLQLSGIPSSWSLADTELATRETHI